MRYFITGCAGFIGSQLSESLLKDGHDVFGIDNFNPFYDPDIKKKNLYWVQQTAEKHNRIFDFTKGDIRSQSDLEEALKGNSFDVFVHLAAMAGVRPSLKDPVSYVDVNEMGTVRVLEAAKKTGVKNFVFASSSSVYGNNQKVPFSEDDPVDFPISTYASTKKAGEVLCHVYSHLYNMSIACLRFFTVYGPRQRPDLAINKFTHLILANKSVPIYGDGTKSRDFTFIDDIVDGIKKAIDWTRLSLGPRYDIFNLGESETTDVLTMIGFIENALQKKATKDFLPEEPGDVQQTFADISKSKRILGYNPTTKIQDGIKKYTDWVLTLEK